MRTLPTHGPCLSITDTLLPPVPRRARAAAASCGIGRCPAAHVVRVAAEAAPTGPRRAGHVRASVRGCAPHVSRDWRPAVAGQVHAVNHAHAWPLLVGYRCLRHLVPRRARAAAATCGDGRCPAAHFVRVAAEAAPTGARRAGHVRASVRGCAPHVSRDWRPAVAGQVHACEPCPRMALACRLPIPLPPVPRRARAAAASCGIGRCPAAHVVRVAAEAAPTGAHPVLERLCRGRPRTCS